MNLNHHINIQTPRLTIRCLLHDDAERMFIMDSDPEVHRFVGQKPTQTIKQTHEVIDFIRQQYLDNGIGRWAVLENQTNAFVG